VSFKHTYLRIDPHRNHQRVPQCAIDAISAGTSRNRSEWFECKDTLEKTSWPYRRWARSKRRYNTRLVYAVDFSRCPVVFRTGQFWAYV